MTLHFAQANPADRRLALGVYMGDGPKALQDLAAFENRLGRPFPIIHLYTGFDTEFDAFRKHKLAPMQREDSIPLVSWAPGVSQGVLYREIAAGHLDPYLKRWAAGIRDWRKPMFIRFAYEMNMRNMAWAGTEANGSPQAFIAAWRHIHEIFEATGAHNVRWVWCPHADHLSPNYTDLMAYYPGDDVVDWVGLDGYYWGGTQESATAAFDRIFKPAYDVLQNRQKPMMIAEVGTPADDKASAQWLLSAFHHIQAAYPQVKAVVYFNADFSQRGEKDWRITERPDMQQAFRQIANETPFSAGVDTLWESQPVQTGLQN